MRAMGLFHVTMARWPFRRPDGREVRKPDGKVTGRAGGGHDRAVRAPSVDVEFAAFRAGVKPTIRRTVEPSQAEALAARWRSQGVAVETAGHLSPMGGRDVAVLYLGHSGDEARALREAEAPVLLGSPTYLGGGGEAVQAQHRALGRALGFPDCCVAAFCARLSRGVDTLGAHRGLAEDYVAAREAWVSEGDARLNTLLMRAKAHVVSFYPCRYDCSAARAVAAATLDAVRVHYGAASAAELVAFLARPVVIAPDGARAVVSFDGARIAAAEVSTGDVRDRALAEGLVNASVGDDGAVSAGGRAGLAAWCVRFVSA